MSYYSLHICSSDGGPQILQLDRRVAALKFAYNTHGCADLQATLVLNIQEQFILYNAPTLPHVIVAYGGLPVWVGRLETARAKNTAMDITAVGYWAALSDVTYTALWIDDDMTNWFIPDSRQLSGSVPDRFEDGIKNGLFSSVPRLNETYGNSPVIANYFGYVVPSQSDRLIYQVEFSWNINLAASWEVGLISYTAPDPVTGSWTFGAAEWTNTGTSTGASTEVFATPTNACAFYHYRATNPNAVYASLTTTNYAQWSSVRIATAPTNIVAQTIASALASYVSGINATQLRATAKTTAVPIANVRFREQYEDMYPSDILDMLCLQESYQAWVTLNRVLVFEPRGTNAATWRIAAKDIEVERATSRVFNRTYALFTETSGRTRRSVNLNNITSQTRNGVIRSRSVDYDGTDSTSAAAFNAAALADSQNPSPRSTFGVRRLLSDQGQLVPLHLPKAGDTMVVQNLPPGITNTVNQVGTFRVGRVAVELSRGSRPIVTIEPDEPIPTLESMLAKLEIN